ncbi:MAG: hypothetical protein MUE53_04450 [Chitinophagales bacterium]|jgi:hypothetical protein|nr:hypothetical protein [Chitinophagales bacterium]
MNKIPNKNNRNISVTQQKTEINITNNNLPDPRIIQEFRHEIIKQESNRENYKYCIALIVFLVLIGLIVFSIIYDALTVASILAGTTILGVISLFLNREKPNQR